MDTSLVDLVMTGLEIGSVFGAVALGRRAMLRHLRDSQHTLTDGLARDLQAATPDPDRADASLAKTSGERIVSSFARAVGDEVRRETQPIRRDMQSLRRELHELREHVYDRDALVDRRQTEHSREIGAAARRLEQVEDQVTGPITLELDTLDDGPS